MIPLLLATQNAHKTQEFASLLGDGYAVQDLHSLSYHEPIVEDAPTFEGNADIKALAVSRQKRGLVVADDSGLCVDVLGGAPGVYSARYAGAQATMSENLTLLQNNLARKGEGPFAGRFVCVLCVAKDGEVLKRFRGECEGRLLLSPSGEGGFGYDPLFVPTGYQSTFAQLSQAEKNALSHRARATTALKNWLETSPH